ncbi:MAG: hypothetical protein JW954_01150 [Dehalococcoidaceae bacterium]|nr:hypothetical protein [Dehalococcoidaceae bacterium]
MVRDILNVISRYFIRILGFLTIIAGFLMVYMVNPQWYGFIVIVIGIVFMIIDSYLKK